MQAKIINENIECKVRRLNLDEVIVNYSNTKGFKAYKYSEVQLVGESELDEFLINNKEFLAIKLNRGISAYFYVYLKEALEEYLQNDLKDFILLKDKYDINKRAIWSKDIILLINYNFAVRIQASGRNFKREEIKISIDQIEKGYFLEWCSEEIKKILKEIERKEIVLSRFGKAIENIKEDEKNGGQIMIE